MTEFRVTSETPGEDHIYEIRDGDEWRVISLDEAKRLGIWQDPRGGQYGVRDDLATSEQVRARMQGKYDPRAASGRHVATRVKLHCVRCGTHLGSVVEFEHRLLYHSKVDSSWSRNPSNLRCAACYAPGEVFGVDLREILQRVTAARHAGKARSLNIGDMSYTRE